MNFPIHTYKYYIENYIRDILKNGKSVVSNATKTNIVNILTYNFIPQLNYNICSDLMKTLNVILTIDELQLLLKRFTNMIYNGNIQKWILPKLFIIVVYLNDQDSKYINESYADFIVYVIYKLSILYKLNGVNGYINWYYKYNVVGILMNKLNYILVNKLLHTNENSNMQLTTSENNGRILLHKNIFIINNVNTSITQICKRLNITYNEFITNLQIQRLLRNVKLTIIDNDFYRTLLYKYSYLFSQVINIFDINDGVITNYINHVESTDMSVAEYANELSNNIGELYYNIMLLKLSIHKRFKDFNKVLTHDEILDKLIYIANRYMFT